MVRPGRPAVTAAAAVSVDGSSAPAVRAVPVASGVSVVAVVTAVTGWMPPGRALTAVMPGMVGTAVPAGVVVPGVRVARTVYSRPLSTPRSSIRSSTPRSG
jgi:hypothetical protein